MDVCHPNLVYEPEDKQVRSIFTVSEDLQCNAVKIQAMSVPSFREETCDKSVCSLVVFLIAYVSWLMKN